MTTPPFIDRRQALRHTVAAGSHLALSLGAISALRLAAQSPDRRGSADAFDRLFTENVRISVRRGLDYLASQQRPNGAFGSEGYRGNVAVCALAAMAMLAAGGAPNRGTYGRAITRFLDYVLASSQESGFINGVTVSHGPMYDHGFAALFLAEVYGMSLRRDLREKLAKAVKIIVESQNAQGGWRYQPVRHEADVSVTSCQLMALRAARNAGLYVPKETIDRAVDYVHKCQNADGGFSYMQDGGESVFPRSAAAIVALFSAGAEADPVASAEISRGLAYLATFRPTAGAVVRYSHYFYGHYYAAQAMWHAGGKFFEGWYPALRDDLISRQTSEGKWEDAFGAEYATAMSCLALQTAKSSLPIFQR